MKYIDLRSDTVTKPTQQMRDIMLKAEVGDDVYCEDPTVNRLQEMVATMFGKEAALFVPSGVMGNQICIRTHTNHGDEVIVDIDSHIFVYENAAPAALSGVSLFPLQGHNGLITSEHVDRAIRSKAYYLPKTKLICLENTHGRSGGTSFPIEEIKKIHEVARENKLKLHLDGARIWNASVASGISFQEYGKLFDSISVCFSKGLGAPIGSMILGDHEFISEALVYRKMFGGGMRQVGIIAAAAQYAIENNIARLQDDHKKAKTLAKGLQKLKIFNLDLETVQTNMVIADIGNGFLQEDILQKLKKNGILLTPERTNSIRAVTHLDVNDADIDFTIKTFNRLFQ